MKCVANPDERLKNFHSGTEYRAYEIFGCHRCADGKYRISVWAPHAKSVAVKGVFSGNEIVFPMNVLSDGECYEAVVNASAGDKYGFLIDTLDGRTLFKADPYAFRSDFPNSFYSVICDLPEARDFAPLAAEHNYDEAMNIYEVNLLSWKRHPDNSYYSFTDLKRELVPYVKELGYTHVEFMPVNEYPFDGSWGYQVTGYFSIISRLGSPYEFKSLIDAFHKSGIKVILDWVPAHFPKDEWALYEFDGQPLYECPLWDRMEHSGWGTRRFDYGRGEIDSFLISSATFLFDVYSIDGLRVDAVASMIYLNYDRAENDFTPNELGGNVNFEGITFIKKLNSAIKTDFHGAIIIAEESTAYDKVTGKIEEGGLGFDYKWNMGWMNDVLFYCRQDPYFRRYHHNKITFSLVYAFSERFILPVSHDEVVHVKGSVVNKMPGEYADKFAGERLLLGYSYAHPGKKLNFMGYEAAQFKEWDYASGLDLFLADEFELHGKMRVFVKELNVFYARCGQLYELDYGWEGFKWLVVDDSHRNLFAFARYDKSGGELVAVMNFSGVELTDYEIKTSGKKYRLVFNTDETKFGGSGKIRKKIYNTVKHANDDEEYYLKISIPKLTCMYFIKQK